MRIFDAHTHLRQTPVFYAEDFYQLAAASTPEECMILKRQAEKQGHLFFACGLHPWRSGDLSVEALLPWFSVCNAIGEIGMDCVWCQVDLEVQRRVFQKQLLLAKELNKPIVLHTKGCEREVLKEIADVSQNILVHWYSSRHCLSEYIQKGCYFSVGPDFLQNEAVQALVDSVPLERLLLESDGASGISWALGRKVLESELPCFLQEQIFQLARRKGMEAEGMANLLFENAIRFLGGLDSGKGRYGFPNANFYIPAKLEREDMAKHESSRTREREFGSIAVGHR